MEGFNVWSVSALIAVVFVVVRDLSSRMLPPQTHPLAVSCLSLAASIPLGLAMLPFSFWAPITTRGMLLCAGSALSLSFAYVMIVQAMRHGEVGVVSAFRYAIMLMAIVVQVAVFASWPDTLTLAGSAVLLATGLYTLYRERKVKGGEATLTSEPAAYPPPQ